MFELLGFIGVAILAVVGTYVYAVVQNKVYLGFYVFKVRNVDGDMYVGVCKFPKIFSLMFSPFFDKYSA